MTKLLVSTGLVMLVFTVVDAPNAFSGPRRPRDPPARRHETLISHVSPTSITIQEDSGPKTFGITNFTEVVIDGQRATVADLRPGMRVSIDLDDPLHAHRITAWRTR
jgi:hypothetical protein